jgi:hypothetical protein
MGTTVGGTHVAFPDKKANFRKIAIFNHKFTMQKWPKQAKLDDFSILGWGIK